MSRSRCLPVFWLFLGVLAAADGQTLGLIDQPQTFPWTVGLAPVVQEEAGGLRPQQGRVQSTLLWFNTYRQYGVDDEMSQQIDMEGLLPMVSAAWSFSEGWELRAQAQGWALGGGILDLFLSGFHGTFFLPNQGRDLVSDGAYRDFLRGQFDQTHPQVGLTQWSVAVRGFQGAFSCSAWVKPPLPAPRDWGWTDRWSTGLSLGWGDHWSLPLASWELGAGASTGLVWAQDEPSFAGVTGGLLPQVGLYATVDTPWSLRGVVQGTWTAPPYSGEAYLGMGPGLLTSGAQFVLSTDWVLELAVTEEFLTWATNEVGFQVGVTWKPNR